MTFLALPHFITGLLSSVSQEVKCENFFLRFEFAQCNSPFEGRAVKFCFANFLTFIFCSKSGDLHGISPPLKGAGGMLFGNFSEYLESSPKNIPLPPCKRGNCIVLIKILGKNFNTLPIVKQNLTALLGQKG